MSDENYHGMSTVVLAENPLFAASEEYLCLVDSGVEDLPGVVLGTFGTFLIRRLPDEEAATSGFATLENLVKMDDQDVREAVVNEVFEVRAEPAAVLVAFYGKLGPRCKELYRKSCRPLPGTPT